MGLNSIQLCFTLKSSVKVNNRFCFSGKEKMVQPLAFHSIVASGNNIFTLGGTYDLSHDINYIYSVDNTKLDCSDPEECSGGTWVKDSRTLQSSRRGKVAISLDNNYVKCKF